MESKDHVDFDMTVTIRSSQIDLKELTVICNGIVAKPNSVASFQVMLIEQEITVKSTKDKKLNILKATIQSE